MAKIDVDALCKAMIGAAKVAVEGQWPQVKSYASKEFKRIAEAMATVEGQVTLGEITEEDAHIQMDMLKNASTAVLAGVEGMGKLAAEAAINAALKAVRDAVNKAIGFALL